MPIPLTTLLAGFPYRDDLHFISEARAYQHAEDAYDQKYGNSVDLEKLRLEGSRLSDLCGEFGLPGGPALEIGCGTGRFSLCLVLSGCLTEILLTDPSPAFCAITAQRLTALTCALPRIQMAVLAAEDLHRLPPNSLSLVAMRSVLHHIADIPAFMENCAQVLLPGGLLLCEEPCHEGYVLMGAMTAILADLLAAKAVGLTPEQTRPVELFVESMRFYARRDLDKSHDEDKHLFRPDELMSLARAHQMEMHFFPNRTFANIHERHQPLPEDYFERFYFDYLKYCMSWDDGLIELFSKHARKYFGFFSCLASGNALPYTYGAFLFRKTC